MVHPASDAVAEAEDNAYGVTENVYNVVTSYVVNPHVQDVVDANNVLANQVIVSSAAASQDAIDAYHDASHAALHNAVSAANNAVADSSAAAHDAVDFFILAL